MDEEKGKRKKKLIHLYIILHPELLRDYLYLGDIYIYVIYIHILGKYLLLMLSWSSY